MSGHLWFCAAVVLIAFLGASPARADLPLHQIQNFATLFGLTAPEDAPSVLRLYFMPTAPIGLDWGSPRRLLVTTVAATELESSHPIGHVEVEVQFRGQDDPQHHIFTGATDINPSATRQFLLTDEMGFSILERAWPGSLETETDHAKTMSDRAGYRNRISIATFLISDTTCQRLLDYYHELLADPNPRYYGFGARPLRSEGSGCSAFGASFTQQIGVLDAGIKTAWTRNVRVPLSLMGGYPGHMKVSVATAAVSSASARWATAQEPNMLLECFDPDLMFQWVVNLHDSPQDVAGLPVQPDTEAPRLLDARYGLGGAPQKNIKAIVVDARDVPTPTGPIFTGAPALKVMTDTTTPSVTRSDKVYTLNGSFEIHP